MASDLIKPQIRNFGIYTDRKHIKCVCVCVCMYVHTQRSYLQYKQKKNKPILSQWKRKVWNGQEWAQKEQLEGCRGEAGQDDGNLANAKVVGMDVNGWL